MKIDGNKLVYKNITYLNKEENWTQESATAYLKAIGVIISKTLEQLKTDKLEALKNKSKQNYQAYLDKYPIEEVETFQDRKTEAKEYIKDNSTPTPFIDASLNAGYTQEDRIKEINAVYAKALYVAKCSGTNRELRNRIEDAISIEELESIEI